MREGPTGLYRQRGGLRPPVPKSPCMQREFAVPLRDLVVVIDDDVAVRNSLQFSLEIDGYAVQAYAGAGKPLDEADLAGRGCLVIDYNLLGTDGLAVLARLRARGVLMPAILIAIRARRCAPAPPRRAFRSSKSRCWETRCSTRCTTRSFDLSTGPALELPVVRAHAGHASLIWIKFSRRCVVYSAATGSGS
jgi:CheY-like chemotaxis protein